MVEDWLTVLAQVTLEQFLLSANNMHIDRVIASINNLSTVDNCVGNYHLDRLHDVEFRQGTFIRVNQQAVDPSRHNKQLLLQNLVTQYDTGFFKA